ncbi:hypothetical protein KBD45_01585 [Candidatus Dojkabacteria bacterium]|nr:hypothetical protein [Candidatus Dojkabacteria bacterium]
MKEKKDLVFVQFETDEFYQIVLDLVLLYFGIKPALKISNREALKQYINDLQKSQRKPDFVVLDTFIGINNEDGKQIAEKLRQVSPSTKIIGYSIMETNEWADFEVIKSSRDQSKTLVRMLETALNEKFNYSDRVDPEFLHD